MRSPRYSIFIALAALALVACKKEDATPPTAPPPVKRQITYICNIIGAYQVDWRDPAGTLRTHTAIGPDTIRGEFTPGSQVYLKAYHYNGYILIMADGDTLAFDTTVPLQIDTVAP